MRGKSQREQVDLREDLRSLRHNQTLCREELPVSRIVQLNIDAYLFAEFGEAAQNHDRRLAPARNFERFIQTNVVVLDMSHSFQQQMKLLPAEKTELFRARRSEERRVGKECRSWG